MRLALLSAICVLVGCSPYEYRLPTTGATLEGTVTYGKETLQMAQINVFGEKGQAIGRIEDGRYKVDNVPLGAVKIGVNTEAERGNAIGQAMARSKGASSGPAPKFINVPAKYQDPETSAITTTIKRGKNTFDIVLSSTGK